MDYKPEFRTDKQQKIIDSTIITDRASGRYSFAKLIYISCHGMYFIADDTFKPGNIVDLHFDVPPLKGAQKRYSATVRWCMLLSEDESNRKYGIGVKYL
jgi:hypothetical protein